MAECAVNFLLNQLSILIQEERQLLGGVDKKVERLKDELELMKAFLRVADAKEDGDPVLQAWVRQVRELAYDAEDVLDLFMLRCIAHDAHEDCRFPGPVKKLYAGIRNRKARRDLAVELGNIDARVKRIREAHQAFQIKYGDAPAALSGPSLYKNKFLRGGDALLVDEAMLVGIEKPKQELIHQLLDRSTQLKAVSVWGMGGLGKSTLVKRTYEDERVKGRFQCHAWVTISQSFDIDELLKNLIRKLYAERREVMPQNLEILNGHDLKEFIKDFLRKKRYIIVLDDVWSIDSWDAFRHALPNSNNGSRVLFTTRIRDVAYAPGPEYFGYIYEMKGLSIDESWTLFCNKTFQDKICPPHLKEISKRILAKCQGLPLAILAIGGLLSLKDNDSRSEWKMVYNSLGSELDGDHGKLGKVKEVILLSYYDLPYYLKTCLLYFSILPEDQMIKRDEIIRLWNSEGFVEGKENMTREEVGAAYLNELLHRSLVKEEEERYIEKGYTLCRIHDIVREVVVAKSREQNLVKKQSERDSSSYPTVRRLAIHGSIEDNNSPGMSSLKQLRSLLFIGCKNSQVSVSEQFINNLVARGNQLLKVLVLAGVPLKLIPNEVFKLYLLTYLDLSNTEVTIIPKSIGKLVHLETLDLSETHVIELPIQILRLKKLRHLFVYKVIPDGPLTGTYHIQSFKAPYQIGCLASLQSLAYIEANHAMGDTSIVREIGKLTQLVKLGISKLRREDGEDLCSSLDKLKHLRFLDVCSIVPDGIIDLKFAFSSLPQFLQRLSLTGRLEKMPQWIPYLLELTRVEFFDSRLRDDPLEFLEELPNLETLCLVDAFQGTTLHFRAHKFPSLKSLTVANLRGLRSMVVDEYSVPRLDELVVYFCKSMELPVGLEHLMKLQQFFIWGMNDNFVKALERAKRSEKKLAHISVIVCAGDNVSNWKFF